MGLLIFVVGTTAAHCGSILVWISSLIKSFLDCTVYWGMLVGCMQFIGWIVQMGVHFSPLMSCGNMWVKSLCNVCNWMVPYVPYTPTAVTPPPTQYPIDWRWATALVTSIVTGIIGKCTKV